MGARGRAPAVHRFTGLNPMPDDVPGADGLRATEAARAALDVAFGGLGMPEVYSMTAVLNEPSQAVMRRLGLTEFAPGTIRGSPRAARCGRA